MQKVKRLQRKTSLRVKQKSPQTAEILSSCDFPPVLSNKPWLDRVAGGRTCW
jgi:hypothetical protein